MSKKSAYRRRREETIIFTAHTWDYLRAYLGWEETGEPVPFDVCQELFHRVEYDARAEQVRVLVALVVEGWRQSYPHAPQQLHMVR
jgi:hypothetical protein